MTMTSQLHTRKFNPENFVKTAADAWQDRLDFNKFIEENSHLAQPFHIDGLENVIPPQYPGELAIYEGRSHHGKSTAMRDAAFKAQKRIEGKAGFVTGIVSLEDTSEGTAGKFVKRYGDPVQFQDDQLIFIGNSFNMSIEDMAELNVSNIISALSFGLSRFADKVQYSSIYVDYAQIIPPDPERRRMTANDQKRLQVADDVVRLFHMAKRFKCPVGLASQALLKQQRDNYTAKMKIPGAADLAEAGELFSVPDIVYAYWMPKMDYPIGTRIEEDDWSFEVTQDLGFVRVVKRRNAEEMGYVGKKSIVGRAFPFHLREDGSYYYSKEFHRQIIMTKNSVE